MSLVQYRYAVAVETYRSFVIAAEKCSVTQPTLSMQIQKLETNLGIKLFNRDGGSVSPTDVGREVIAQARVLLAESSKIEEIVRSGGKLIFGELRIGIIPTLAPYIIPPILPQFKLKYPQVKLVIWEQTTDQIVQQLKLGLIDCGVVSTMRPERQLVETPLFYENFVAYFAKSYHLFEARVLDLDDINIRELWILNEGHCMRDQVLRIFQCDGDASRPKRYEYHTGSIDTLKRMVDENNGITILPEFALRDLTKSQLSQVRHFQSPKPNRRINMVTRRDGTKHRLAEILKMEILELVPKHLKGISDTSPKP